jgi:LCP family protein required for cell wall assembly
MTHRTRPRIIRSASHQGVARHGRISRRDRFRRLISNAVIVVAVLIVSGGSIASYAAWSVFHSAAPSVAFSAAPPVGQAVHEAPALTPYSGAVNMLVVASDTRTGQGPGFQDAKNLDGSSGVGHNDTTLLLHINQEHTSMAVIDLPRDLVVPLPACQANDGSPFPAESADMLNNALKNGGYNHGLQCVAAAVAQLTGVQIDYAAMLDFDGVVKMTTAVGGVSVCLATPIHDTDVAPALNLTAGTHVLEGNEAAAFLRTRYGVGFGGDTARISNQQVFMSALARQMTSGGTLSNPVKLYSLASAAVQSIQKSASLNVPTLIKIALATKQIGLGNIVFLQYPSVPDPANADRLLPDPAGVAVLKKALTTNQNIQLSPGSLGQSARLATPAPSTSTTPAPKAAMPSSTSAAAAVLPSTSTGQSAAQQTCSAKGD